MLKKLIKYEWKAVLKMNLLMLAIAAGVGLVGTLYFHTPMWKNLTDDTGYGFLMSPVWILVGVGGLFTYVIMLLGVKFGQMIYFGNRYFQSMFSGQGYLTHTLPVTPAQLLFSKVFIAGVWTFLINVAMLALTALLILSMILGISDASLREVWSDLTDGVNEALKIYGIKESGSLVFGVALTLIAALLDPFLGAGILFGALTIGHYSKKNKGLMGILAYFGVLVVRALLGGLIRSVIRSLMMPALKDLSMIGEYYTHEKNTGNLLADLILAAGLLVWAHHIIKNRLNME